MTRAPNQGADPSCLSVFLIMPWSAGLFMRPHRMVRRCLSSNVGRIEASISPASAERGMRSGGMFKIVG